MDQATDLFLQNTQKDFKRFKLLARNQIHPLLDCYIGIIRLVLSRLGYIITTRPSLPFSCQKKIRIYFELGIYRSLSIYMDIVRKHLKEPTYGQQIFMENIDENQLQILAKIKGSMC